MDENILTIEDRDGITIVHVTEKRIYRDVVEPFKNKMVSLLDAGRRKILIDLTQVEVMNSLGLGVLILVWDCLKKENGQLAVCGLCHLLQELFRRMRLNLVFHVTETVEEGVRMIREGKKNPAI